MVNPLLSEGNVFSTVVDQTVHNIAAFKMERRLLRDTALIPVYASAISFTLLVAYLFTRVPPVRRLITRLRASSSDEPIGISQRDAQFVTIPPPTFRDELKEHIASHGGVVIYLRHAFRLAICLALLGISIHAAIAAPGPQPQSPSLDMATPDTKSDAEAQRKPNHGKHSKHWKQKKGEAWFSYQEWVEIAQCIFYAYTSLLALLTIAARRRLARVVSRHLTTLLVVAWSVYAYRDLYPLATYTEQPVDAADGWVTWVRIGLLTIVGTVLPLIVPRRFVPVDPKNPLPPNPEQTASILSLITWSFLDPVVLEASRVSHLPYESLPVLADYDHAEHLMANAAPTLDPSLKPRNDRHLVWGLLWLYRWEYAAAVLLMTVKAVFSLVSPFVLNRLLHYLETGGEGAVYKPWVWITGLFLAPALGTAGFELYLFITNRLLIRTEALVTQLIFEHSLKIRIKSETGSESSSAASRAASVHEPEHQGEGSGDTLIASGEQPSSSPKRRAPPVAPSEPSSPTPSKKDEDSQKDKNLVGMITNLISTDLENIVEARDFLFVVWYAPLQIALSVWFLYRILGWAAFVSLAVMLATIPIPVYVATLLNTLQVEQMKVTDARVQAVTDTLGVIRMIKLFGWERKIEAQINEKRDGELKFIRKKHMFGLLSNNVNHILPRLTIIATFATYTFVMKKQLSASIVFSSIAVFEVLRDRMFMAFWELPRMIGAKVSFDRINDFLLGTELLDRYTSSSNTISLGALPPTADSEAIGFRNAVFSWSAGAPSTPGGPMTPSRRNFRLRIEDDLFFEKGKLNLIIGPTGCGKTSMIMALLGEMHFQPEILDSFYNLPRGGGVAYAAQEAWIQNATVKDNIIFGAPYDEDRYCRVLKQCALERDLTLFEAGDATEIGEKGVTLSGGQKARVSLARAIYSSAEIILLDDILSALDVHTSRWIVDKCLRGDLVKGRTIVLVTHHVAMVAPIADFVVSIGSDGRILSQGQASDALQKDANLASEVEEDQEIMEKQDKVEKLEGTDKPKDAKPTGQLIAAEEIVEGRIGLPAFKFFFGMFGSIWFWTAFVVAMAGFEVVRITQTWWLGYWARQYQFHSDPCEVNDQWYLGIYGALVIFNIFVFNPGQIIFILGSLEASKITHNRLVQSVLGTTMRWLDSTPHGRIIARFTRDMRSVDAGIPDSFNGVFGMQTSLLFQFGAIIIYSPGFLVPGLVVAAVGAWLGQVYIRAQLAVKREMSNAKSPLYSHFGAAIAGLISIRAYGAEEKFKLENLKRINFYSRPGRTFYNLNRWISTRIDILGGLFTAALGAYLVYAQKRNSSDTGFSLTMALSFTFLLLWWIRLLNGFEVEGNSLERIKGYVEIEQEPLPTQEGIPPAAWPTSGSLRVEKLSARYSSDGPNVLHEISFEIKSGEHVGVVGRTGAGKSSLSLSLLRMIPTTGSVFFDGVDTQKINLDTLRNNITIVPQQPDLISGTLRYNLDPFGEHDDAELSACLRSAGLFNLQSEDDEDKIGLDTEVASGGTNFSLGQRQIIALARAMVRRSKIYLLDEATASVDYKTDAAIQEAIATEFNDMTLIIVAHRLQTIMNADKILVLDAGRVVEFDTPQALLAKDGSRFKGLVDASGDKDALYELASKKGQGSSRNSM